MKAAILILSDPKAGSEEAFGRVASALTVACYFKQSGAEVTVLFQGAGRGWIEQIASAKHPLHALFEEIKDTIAGLSCPAEDAAATEETMQSDVSSPQGNTPSDTCRIPIFQELIAEGYAILTF